VIIWKCRKVLSNWNTTRGVPHKTVQEANSTEGKDNTQLLKILENTERNIHQIEEQTNYMSLLAQFKGKNMHIL